MAARKQKQQNGSKTCDNAPLGRRSLKTGLPTRTKEGAGVARESQEANRQIMKGEGKGAAKAAKASQGSKEAKGFCLPTEV